ncbi:antileukoproteinase-like [Amphibalanus amphitrite]|uniref:antileukoproteinase-like n=1 Tax=Amphibalanus amphitrite TaxID=1232801 RepID=UPI001C911994|nr:antileukoproteinase-like [Amphibalanus amphitrite]
MPPLLLCVLLAVAAPIPGLCTVRLQKDGHCPPLPAAQCDVYPLPDTCQSDDFNCPGALKCCVGGCSKSCVRPVFPPDRVKPGLCPLLTIASPCPEDGEVFDCRGRDLLCPGAQKCCSSRCGTRCADPILPGAPTTTPTPIPEPDWEPDLDSEPGPEPEDLRDPDPEPLPEPGPTTPSPDPSRPKPGHCPVPQLWCACAPLPDKCTGDSDCPGQQKCCYTCCNKECVFPKGLVG